MPPKPSTPPPLRLSDLTPAPYNPREIDEPSFEALGYSLREFGDISGITWNRRTGNLVTGHQRMRSLRERYGDKLKMQRGVIKTPSGEAFRVRVVDWIEGKEMAANVAANSAMLSGSFTDDLVGVLEDVRDNAAEFFEPLRLNELMTPTFEPVGLDEQGKLDEKAMTTCPECGYEFSS